MLRLGRLYIHFLTIAMFVLFFLNHHIAELCCAYFSMLLHEAAHLAAAAAIGLKVSHFALYPFGVNLRLKNKLVANISDELILYLSGPLTNVVIALSVIAFKNRIPNGEFLYRTNVMLFVMNMLPITPLDGGCITERLLNYFCGAKAARVLIMTISAAMVIIMLLLGIYTLRITGYNYSILLLAVFLIGNLFTQRKKYGTEYMRELMFYRNKPLKRIRFTAAYEDENDRDIVRKFIPRNYNIVCRLNKSGGVKEFKSETEIVDGIMNNFSTTTKGCHKTL